MGRSFALPSRGLPVSGQHGPWHTTSRSPPADAARAAGEAAAVDEGAGGAAVADGDAVGDGACTAAPPGCDTGPAGDVVEQAASTRANAAKPLGRTRHRPVVGHDVEIRGAPRDERDGK